MAVKGEVLKIDDSPQPPVQMGWRYEAGDDLPVNPAGYQFFGAGHIEETGEYAEIAMPSPSGALQIISQNEFGIIASAAVRVGTLAATPTTTPVTLKEMVSTDRSDLGTFTFTDNLADFKIIPQRSDADKELHLFIENIANHDWVYNITVREEATSKVSGFQDSFAILPTMTYDKKLSPEGGSGTREDRHIILTLESSRPAVGGEKDPIYKDVLGGDIPPPTPVVPPAAPNANQDSLDGMIPFILLGAVAAAAIIGYFIVSSRNEENDTD